MSAPPPTLDVAMIIPALDEEGALPAVLAAIPREGVGWRVAQVIVADNGSTDRTAEVSRAHGATVVLESRRGYGAACLAGLAELGANPPQLIAFLDGDGSSDPTELPSLLTPLLNGSADLVIGSRVLGHSESGALTPVQRFGNRLATGLLRAFYGVRFTDLGPMRAVRWEALEKLRMRDRDFGWTVEMQARAAAAGLRVTEVPVTNRRRCAGRSKVAGTIRGSIGAGWKILFTLARVRLGG